MHSLFKFNKIIVTFQTLICFSVKSFPPYLMNLTTPISLPSIENKSLKSKNGGHYETACISFRKQAKENY